MTISRRDVKHARRSTYCANCERIILKGEPYTDLYGYAFRSDGAGHMHLCPECVTNGAAGKA